MFKFLFPILACLSTPIVPLQGYTSLDQFNYSITQNNTLSIDGFKNTDHDLDIDIAPSYTIDNQSYDVTNIGDYAFYRNSLNSVILPSSLQSIGDFSFGEENVVSTAWDTSDKNKDDRAISIDMSQCNNLSYMGDYAFHCDTIGNIILPSNNNSLTSLGEDAFTGVRYLCDMDFSGFKALTRIGTWEFYADENGYNNLGNFKIVLPNTITELAACAFTWSEVKNLYLNVTDVTFGGSGGACPGGINFFLTSFNEVHVNINADLNHIEDLFASQGAGLYHINKLIADINNDGTINSTPSNEIDNVGVEFNSADVRNGVYTLLNMQIPSLGFTLNDIALDFPYFDDELNDEYSWFSLLVESTIYPSSDPIWAIHSFQCELFCLWDRYFRFNNPILN